MERLGIHSEAQLSQDEVNICINVDDEPQTLEHAKHRPDWSRWEAAILQGKESLQRNGTWELTEFPEGKKAIGCKWVFRIKRKANHEILKYKARLVAKGFNQKADVDCTEAFAPVARYGSIQMLLALTAEQDWEVEQLVVKTAFLSCDLKETIYMDVPGGYEGGTVWPFAPRAWADAAAVAITTTDLVSKSVAIETMIGGTCVKLGGIAKGSGMIHPNMATMLGVVTTDASVTVDVWRSMVLTAVNRSFNQITVDGDTSTNDTLLGLASGKAGAPLIDSLDSIDAQRLQSALDAVLQGLAKSIAWDGEGATCLIEVKVTGAESEVAAATVAKSVASSSLAKAAVYGRDPNWGRIACAAGYSGVNFDPNDLRIHLGEFLLMEAGQPMSFDRAGASAYLKKAGDTHGTVQINISVGSGPAQSFAWGCDLSYDYVKINAEYTT